MINFIFSIKYISKFTCIETHKIKCRSGKWEKAQKLCKMILIYEPRNDVAMQFKDLIEEKIQVVKIVFN